MKQIQMTTELQAYLQRVSLREHPVLAALRESTAEMTNGQMQIPPEQGQLLAMLIKMLGATHVLEIGVFTGYSSTVMALALPEDGRLLACDKNSEWTGLAQDAWQQAGVAEKITLKLAPALETLQQLVDDGAAGSIDFVFIDADKKNQIAYFDYAYTLVRQGGVIACDNTLFYGNVIDETKQDETSVAIRDFNQWLFEDERVDISMIPIADGLTIARKK